MPDAGVARRLLGRLIAPHRPALSLFLLVVILYLPGVWLREPWNPDEPRYTQVMLEMMHRGDFILPHLNGEVYSEKPPLFFWLGAMAGALPDVPHEAGPRVVSALAAWLTLLLTLHIGRRLTDAETGWLAALILATSSLFAIHAATGVIDSLLTLLVTAAIALGLQARRTRSPVLWGGVYFLAGLAVLTKGPVGFLLPLGVLLVLTGHEDGLRGLRAWHALWGLLLIAVVAAVWVGPAIARGGPEYAQTILLKQNVGRAFQSWHHARPMTYYLGALPVALLPWTFFLPTALWTAWRPGGGVPAKASRTAGLWFAYIFILFSLISGKKTRYLLPLFPALSLLVSLELKAVLAGARGRIRSALPLALTGITIAAVGLALVLTGFAGLAPGGREGLARWLGAADLPEAQAAPLLDRATPPGNVALVLPGLLVLGLAGWGITLQGADRKTALAGILAACLLLTGWLQWVAAPTVDILKSGRPLAQVAQRAAGPDGAIGLYRDAQAGLFNIQLGRDRIPVLRGAHDTDTFLQENRGAVLIGHDGDLESLRDQIESLEIVACRQVGSSKLCAARLTPHP